MANRIINWLVGTHIDRPVILNIGSGAQDVERKVHAMAHDRGKNWSNPGLVKLFESSRFITLDLANMGNAKLMRKPNVWHIQADSRQLPLADNSIDLAVSNHSIDMLRVCPPEFLAALNGVARVLKPAGAVYFNYHHSSLYPAMCSWFASEKYRKYTPQKNYYDPSKPNPYYSDITPIVRDLDDTGLAVNNVELVEDDLDRWWQVKAKKAA